jgi:hypothetical protein
MAKRTVLFGETLREAITILLRLVSGRPSLLKDRLPGIAQLAVKVSKFVADNKGLFGRNECSMMFRSLLEDLLKGKEMPMLTLEVAEALIAGERP